MKVAVYQNPITSEIFRIADLETFASKHTDAHGLFYFLGIEEINLIEEKKPDKKEVVKKWSAPSAGADSMGAVVDAINNIPPDAYDIEVTYKVKE